MQPEENKTETSETSQDQKVETQSQPEAPVSTEVTLPPKKSHKKLMIAVIVLVLLIVAGGAFVLYRSKHHHATTTPVTTTAKTPTSSEVIAPIVTNTWTGKAHTDNWSDAANWSLGVPANNQNLEINATQVTQPTPTAQTGTTVVFKNDVPNLTINKLILDGQVDSFGLDVTGDPLVIVSGIEDTIAQTNPVSGPQVVFDNSVSFSGDASIKTTGQNFLTFHNSTSAITIAGNKAVQLSASGTSQLSVSGPVAGSGAIRFAPNAIASSALVTFSTASPNFNGKVMIDNGNIVRVGNQTATNSNGSTNAFGSSSIIIADGGAMYVYASSTSSMTLNNNITMGGVGVVASRTNVGNYTGAISACITTGEDDCDAGMKVNLTGKVTLTGNTQLGVSYGGEGGGTPSGTTVTYSLSNVSPSKYSLTAVPSSQAIIQQ